MSKFTDCSKNYVKKITKNSEKNDLDGTGWNFMVTSVLTIIDYFCIEYKVGAQP